MADDSALWRTLIHPERKSHRALQVPTDAMLRWKQGDGVERHQPYDNHGLAMIGYHEHLQKNRNEGYEDTAADAPAPGDGVQVVRGEHSPGLAWVRWFEGGRKVRELKITEKGRLSKDTRYGADVYEFRCYYLNTGRDYLHYFETPDGLDIGALRCWRSDGQLAKRMDFADMESPFAPGAEDRPLRFLNDKGSWWDSWRPWGPTFQEQSKGRAARTHDFADHDAALAKWHKLVAQRVKKGYRMLAPWRHYADGERIFSARPPVNAFLHTRWGDGPEERERHDSHEAALEAFNAAVQARSLEGFGPVEEAVFAGLPLDAASYVRFTFLAEDDAFMQRRENYIRRADFSDERQFGPGFEYYSSGSVVLYDNLNDVNSGWNRDFAKAGHLDTLIPHLSGKKEGVGFTMNTDGRVKSAALYRADEAQEPLTLTLRTPKSAPLVDGRHETGYGEVLTGKCRGSDALENRVGEWQAHRDGRLVRQMFYDEDTHFLWRIVKYFEDGRVDNETTAPGPGVPRLFSATAWRKDGSGLYQTLSSDGVITAEQPSYLTTRTQYKDDGETVDWVERTNFVRPGAGDGSATEVLWREGYRDDGSREWRVEPDEKGFHASVYREDGETLESEGRVEDGRALRRTGAWRAYDEDGVLSEYQTWRRNTCVKKRPPKKRVVVDAAKRKKTLARSLDQKPTRASWLKLCAELEGAARAGDGSLAGLLSAVEATLSRWPARVRMAPLPWGVGFVTGVLPMDLLRVCSALSLAPLIYGSANDSNNTHYADLLTWIRALPADTPAPLGLHLGLRETHLKAIDAACDGADGDLQPLAFVEECKHLDTDDMKALLKSPLCRNLEVLDLSMDIPNEDIYGGSQDTLFGRWVRLGEVVKALPNPEKLVSLDIHGSGSSTGEINRTSWRGEKTPNLKALNVGGSHPVNTKDAQALARMLKDGPLEALHMACNQSIHGIDADLEDEDVYYTAEGYWNVYDNDSMKTSAAAVKKLLKALPSLNHLVLHSYYEDDAKYQKALAEGEGLVVDWRNTYRLGWSAAFEADWDQHFEF